MYRSASTRLLSAVPVFLLISAFASTPVDAQRGGSHLHDASLAANFLFVGDPGTTRSYTCSVATGVRYTATNVLLALQRRDFRIPDGNAEGHRVPDEVQHRLGSLLAGGPGGVRLGEETAADWSPAADAMIAALTPAENNHRQARSAAEKLIRHLDGLAFQAQRLNPARPGYRDYRTANKVAAVIKAFNHFIEVSSLEYLTANPVELVAIQTVLNQLVIAGLEYEGQVQVCMSGWIPPLPKPVLERPIQICVATRDGEFREVTAIFVPSTGDTLAVVDGRRTPFAGAYPETTALAGDRDWFIEDEVLTFRNRNYVKFGVPQIASPSALTRVGAWRDVSLYVSPSEANATPSVLYVPVTRGCVVQPYQPLPRARG
jgi:hypothetical protein